ncbi:outer membrane protein OmpA-like peptidoglycan-associated protein [Lacinutrix venerupis]|uniref:OmpA family protein n=1 Tax=Lacinutrix venerupis TaxID=1486034 RepID=UPI000EAF6408|nr:OmpA family protein [Lacinutrix venerupis]RLJ62419.1 outer membrane protein OmpA-like peptidoglycan-associated protein [Lacinutrix venerupis]
MKPFSFFFLTIAFILSIQFTNAQTINNPWITSFGANAINNPLREQEAGLARFKTWNLNAAGFRLSAGRLIKHRVTFEAVASLNSLEENFPTEETANLEFPYISLDGMFKYQFTNGLKILDPYITIGGGYTWLDTIGAGTVNGGIGTNIWVGNSFGFTIQSTYKHAFEDYGLKHWQHSAGIVFRYGGKDKDKDGINDDEDACPELFGTFETNGCPDTDKDGVIDTEDLCPNDYGPSTMRGCPDNDGDGTPDKYDKCPKVKGEIEDDGCPVFDTDKDGVIDRIDKCPQQPGPPQNGGCPTPQQIQQQKTAERQKIIDRNNKIKAQVISQLETFAKNIKFENGNTILTNDAKTNLDKIADIIISQPNMKFHIAGHTDSVGNNENNMLLSEKRASEARKYLISKGVNSKIITSQGYGENKPIADNNTKDGRLKNRRIEIFIVN